MRFRYQRCDVWPALSWMASRTIGSDSVLICHGGHVETHEDWFGETGRRDRGYRRQVRARRDVRLLYSIGGVF